MSSNTLLIAGPVKRSLVALGGALSATTNPFPLFAPPRAKDGEPLEDFLGIAFQDSHDSQLVGSSTPQPTSEQLHRDSHLVLPFPLRRPSSNSSLRPDQLPRSPRTAPVVDSLDQWLVSGQEFVLNDSRTDSLSATSRPRSTGSSTRRTRLAVKPTATTTVTATSSLLSTSPSPHPSTSHSMRTAGSRTRPATTSSIRIGSSISSPRTPLSRPRLRPHPYHHTRNFWTLRPSPSSNNPSLVTDDRTSSASQSSPNSQPPPFLHSSKQRDIAGQRAPQPSRAYQSQEGRAGIASSHMGKDLSIGDGNESPIVDRTPPPSDNPPQLDQINTLLRHPTLHDPVLAPRLPLVLCHGLYGFDVRGPTFFRLHYWGDLLKILRGKIGADVFVTAVPGTGAIKQRAHVLHQSIEGTQGLLGRDFNFVAHSMGGLDARYLLSNIRPTTYNPRSLTTISTPHRGSEFMAWCRANIGIGTDFDKSSEEAARLLHEDTSIPLPYSLKSPILSRGQPPMTEKQQEAAVAAKKAKDAVEKVKADNFPGLPFSLSAALSGYLLDLLDSPAYANLTPSFLRDVFNPSTIDREDVKYYSVAARTDKMAIWHPLWLPKLVLDGAEEAREAKGLAPTDPRWRGNDGLVTIESAKWGEFLGVIDNCDHWEVRGSSGLVNAAASAKAVADVTGSNLVEKTKDSGWKWQDVYALVGLQSSDSPSESKKKADAKPAAKVGADESNLTDIVEWIVSSLPSHHLPKAVVAAVTEAVSPSTSKETNKVAESPTSSTKSTPLSGSPKPQLQASPSVDSNNNGPNQAARLLYGAPKSSAHPEKFNLERMALALCHKLHKDGF